MTNSSVIKNIVKSSFANVFLWYDWYIYAIVSLYLTDNFFPSDSKSGAFVKAMLIFSLSFVVRSLGGWFFAGFAAEWADNTEIGDKVTDKIGEGTDAVWKKVKD